MVKPIVPHATDNILGAARAIARAIRLLRRRSQREERLRSLLLSTAGARFPTLAADAFLHQYSALTRGNESDDDPDDHKGDPDNGKNGKDLAKHAANADVLLIGVMDARRLNIRLCLIP